MSTDGLEGKVALVGEGGEPVGRAIALALAARRVRVVVLGRDERKVGETVGEVVFGGGKARHIVGELHRLADRDAAVARAVDVFGGLDFVVGGERDAEALRSVAPRVGDGGALVAVGEAKFELDEAGRTEAQQLRRRAVSLNAVAFDRAVEPDVVAQLVVFLCASSAQRLTGHTLAVR